MQVSQPLTERGTVLGTFQYMAPEQLEGKEADARSDIFAFGAVLYEMATGKKAFSGSSQASLIGSILRDDPTAISEISPMTPPALNRVVKTCLAKDPEDRFQTAHDAKLQLQWIAEGGSQAGLPAPVVARRKNREKLAWSVAAVAFVAAALATAGYLRRAPREAVRVSAFLLPPEKSDFDVSGASCGSLTVSPDGRHATFTAKDAEGKMVLWLRSLGELGAKPIGGTRGATFPFWSPDSRFLAFFAEGKLQKVDISGAPPLPVCDAPNGRSGSWSREGVILFSPDSTTGLSRVPAAGGAPKPATTLDAAHAETTHRWAAFLPDGRHFLYMAGSHSTGSKSEANAIYVGALDSNEKTLLLQARSNVVYASGYLLYMRERILLGQRFDAGSRRLVGEAFPVAEGVQYDPAYFRGVFSASEDGRPPLRAGRRRLVHDAPDLDGPGGKTPGRCVRRARGVLEPLARAGRKAHRRGNQRPGHGGRLDLDVRQPRGPHSIHLRRSLRRAGLVARRQPHRLSEAEQAVDRRHPREARRWSGRGNDLFHSERPASPDDWSPDGRFLLVDLISRNSPTKGDVWAVPLSGGGKPCPFLATEFNERSASFSPDGKWVAYVSNESGREELYVVPFPGPGPKYQISSNGSQGGGFFKGGKEILYGTLENNVVAVEVKAGPAGLEVGPPKRSSACPRSRPSRSRPTAKGFSSPPCPREAPPLASRS